MSSNIYIKSVHIKNYRSIVDETFTFDPACNTLVGQNNAGKTNIMRALNVAMRMGEPASTLSLTRWDYNDPAQPVLIEVVLGCVDGNSDVGQHYSSCLRGDELTLTYDCKPLDDGSGDVVASRKGNVAVQGVSGGSNKKADYLSDHLKFLYIPSLREPNKTMSATGTSPLQQLLKVAMPSLGVTVAQANTQFQSAIAADTALINLRDLLKQNISENTGIPLQSISLSLAEISVNDLLQQISFAIDDGIETPIAEKGFGLQNAVVIAILQYLAKQGSHGLILCIEEPEIGLHPHAQRKMFRTLADLQGANQVIVSTHSSHVAILWHQRDFADTLTVVKRDPATHGTVKRRVEPGQFSTADMKLLRNHLLLRLGGEVFFARKLLLVEGATELGALPALARRLDPNYDFDVNGITVVSVGGWVDILVMIRLCHLLDMDYLALFDRDTIKAYEDDYPWMSRAEAQLKVANVNDGKRLHNKLAGEVIKNGAPLLDPVIRDNINRLLLGATILPSQANIDQINSLLSGASCRILSSDFENVILHGLEQFYGARPDYDVFYQAYEQIYDHSTADALKITHAGDSAKINKFLHDESKHEYYWRILFDSCGSGSDWIAPELVQLIKDVVS